MHNPLKIRVIGYLDETVLVEESAYREHEENKTLDAYMGPILEMLETSVTYGTEEDFVD